MVPSFRTFFTNYLSLLGPLATNDLRLYSIVSISYQFLLGLESFVIMHLYHYILFANNPIAFISKDFEPFNYNSEQLFLRNHQNP